MTAIRKVFLDTVEVVDLSDCLCFLRDLRKNLLRKGTRHLERVWAFKSEVALKGSFSSSCDETVCERTPFSTSESKSEVRSDPTPELSCERNGVDSGPVYREERDDDESDFDE